VSTIATTLTFGKPIRVALYYNGGNNTNSTYGPHSSTLPLLSLSAGTTLTAVQNAVTNATASYRNYFGISDPDTGLVQANTQFMATRAKKYIVYLGDGSYSPSPDGVGCCKAPFDDANYLRNTLCVTILAVAEGQPSQIIWDNLNQITGSSGNVYTTANLTSIAQRINSSQ